MNVARLPVRLAADVRRVIARPFVPGQPARLRSIIERVRALPDAQVSSLLGALVTDYQERHKDIRAIFAQSYTTVSALAGAHGDDSEDRRLLIGSYFTNEYSLESVALFNPSMVLHPDQSGLPPDAVRFVMSLRACGEGHISSIEFRSGTIDVTHDVTVDPPTRFALTARPIDDARYDKASYALKLLEMQAYRPIADAILAQLDAWFTIRDLRRAIEKSRPQSNLTQFKELVDNMLWLAHSNYELEFSPETALSERVIFPVSENVLRFKVNTLNGSCVQNKGMALFPRKIGGKFVMASRLDGENIYLLKSENIHFWNESRIVYGPKYPWDIVQVGNCGSPIETEEGWILLTHGVGPMRQYCMSALLLDLEDPSRVIGMLTEPMLVPGLDERDGYVPNVVYSCGALLHGDHLIVPYAVSDSHTSVARVKIVDLLQALRLDG
jgi:hypothetical protein